MLSTNRPPPNANALFIVTGALKTDVALTVRLSDAEEPIEAEWPTPKCAVEIEPDTPNDANVPCPLT